MMVASELVTKENKDFNQTFESQDQASESEIEEFAYCDHASESTDQAYESQDHASESEDQVSESNSETT